jgi:hypothetical protein
MRLVSGGRGRVSRDAVFGVLLAVSLVIVPSSLGDKRFLRRLAAMVPAAGESRIVPNREE